jgi:hypothetical protein
MNLTINGKAIKKQTLIILGLIATGAAASQVTAVNHFLSYHPRLAPLGQFLLAAIAVLHTPYVEQILFHQQEQQPDGTEVDTKVSVTPGAPPTK